MSRVLVSFLGTGISNSHRYDKVTYNIEGTACNETTLIAEAITKHYGIEKLILVGTAKSMWEEVYDRFAKINGVQTDEDYLDELLDYIDNAGIETDPTSFPNPKEIEKALGKDSHIIIVDYGINNEQLKSNTEKILGIEQFLEYNDELIVDITHGFRSLPIAMMNLLVYLQNISGKTIEISHILYGMREIEKDSSVKLGKVKNEVPIIDLNKGEMGIVNINKWISGAYAFKEFGKGYQIADLLKNKYVDLTNNLNNLSDIQSLNYLKELPKCIKDFIQQYEDNKKDLSSLEVMSIEPAIDELKSYKLDNSSNTWQFQLNLSRWQYSKQNYLASYATLTECVISYVCAKSRSKETGKPFDCNSFIDREIVKGKKIKGKNDEVLNESEHNYIADFPDIYKIYEDDGLKIIRNALVHNKSAKDREGNNKLNYDSLKNVNNIDAQLKRYIDRLMHFLI